MTDIIDQTRREIADRIEQLRPAVAEYARLQAAVEALASIGGEPSTDGAKPAPPARRRPRPRRTPRTASRAVQAAAGQTGIGRPRRGRPASSGGRGEQALKLIEEQPGITIRQIAAQLNMGPGYLYRLLPPLQQEGKIERRNAGWHVCDTG